MWHKYRNGTYDVLINDVDGTKIRQTDDESDFIAAFPESMDVNLTTVCDGGCPWCYQCSSKDGKHSDIMNQKWVDTLHTYTELALNGNDLTHPDLIPFLYKLRDMKVIANLTVNQKHFMKKLDFLRELTGLKLIHGLGISLVNPTDEFISEVKKFPTAVIHTINGIITKEYLEKLADNDLKILVLGYKHVGNGNSYYDKFKNDIEDKINWMKNHLSDYTGRFNVISFDNLAINQLECRRWFDSDEEWNKFYLGDDGLFSFYIDAVNHTFSKSSLESESRQIALMDSVEEMFKRVKELN